MTDFKVDDADYDLWLLLARTHYHIKAARTAELRHFDLSPEQAGVVYFVASSGNHAMPTEIARWMQREPQTITSILDRMVKKGFLVKNDDAHRRNVVRVSLTEKGWEAFKAADRRETFHEVMTVLSAEQRSALRATLNALREAAQASEKRN